MVRLIFKLFLFAAIFFVFDKLFIIVANRSAESEIEKRLEYLVNGEINKDLVILGSSRGSRDIIASQIEDETGLSSYNLCYPGSNVDFHDFIFQTLIKFNRVPEFLVLVVDDNEEFIPSERIIFRRDRLYPLIKYPYIWKEMAQRGYLDNDLSNILVLQRLNKYNFDLRQKRFTPNDTVFSCGSMTYSWQRKGVNWNYISTERDYPEEMEDPGYISAFNNIIKTCNDLDIKTVILFPPNYRPSSHVFEARIRQLSGNNVYYHHYDSENPIYWDKDYFYDTDHLIRKGATIYTDEIIGFLNGIFDGSIQPGNYLP